MDKKNIYNLANTSWPSFRSNMGNNGRSSFSGPKGNKIIWKVKVGKSRGEPSVGLDGMIYLPLQSKKLAKISTDGKILWKKSFYSFMKKSLRGVTTPAIREDGSLIVSTFRKVFCLEPDGSIRWEKLIDGLPTSPNIGPSGLIYISANSISWSGTYVISAIGESYGEDDPTVYNWKNFSWMMRKSRIYPVSLDAKGNFYVIFQANVTHPEAYTWDPPDEVDEEFYYECAIFDSKGKRIGQFFPDFYQPIVFTSTNSFPNSITLNENLAYYIGGDYGDFFVFNFDDLKSIDINENTDWLAYGPRSKVVEKLINKCVWTWDKNRAKEYIGETRGYPAIGLDGKIWVRLNQSFKSQTKKKKSKHAKILVLDPNDVKSKKILQYHTINLDSKIEIDPIIDGENLIYITDIKGVVHIFDSSRNKINDIETGHSIKYVIIGTNSSLLIVTKDGYLLSIK